MENISNEYTLTGDKISEIEQSQLYILKDHNTNYAFHIKNIWEWVCDMKNLTNPYTNNKISDTVILEIDKLYNEYLYKNLNTNNNNNALIMDYNAELTDLFIQIDSMGCYANMEGYKSLDIDDLWNFFKTFYDYYEIIKTLVDTEDPNRIAQIQNYYQRYQETLNNSPERADAASRVKFAILLTLKEILQNYRATTENIALLFTLHLSEKLSPNNDDLGHFYLHDINYLIRNIIRLNTFSDLDSLEEDSI